MIIYEHDVFTNKMHTLVSLSVTVGPFSTKIIAEEYRNNGMQIHFQVIHERALKFFKFKTKIMNYNSTYIMKGGLVSCIFILLSRESDQCAIRARLGVASHLSTTPRWGNPAKCLSQRHNK